MDQKKIDEFKDTVVDFYKKEGRHDMPWRHTNDPYRILVSEIMLQQTQVDRVAQKYHEFITTFPTIKTLAEAPLGNVLAVWSGLGYNRRAKFLKQAAEKITENYKGTVPQTIGELKQLPGIGEATAAAILTYAYNKPIPYIETNVRTVFIHYFFHDKKNISDGQLFPLVKETLNENNPREWYWALMDYGTHLKKIHGNLSQKSRHYLKQSKFIGSRRQKRSAIIRALVNEKELTKIQLHQQTAIALPLLDELSKELIKEGMIIKTNETYSLP